MIPKAIISVPVQAAGLRSMFPKSSVEVKRGRLIWIGELQPSDLSAVYTLGLEYRLGDQPTVYVITPELKNRDQRRPPHLYPDDSLCLYFPNGTEWNANMMLADAVVPWASEWLLHYEIWLATGEWCGGGFHPKGGAYSQRRQTR